MNNVNGRHCFGAISFIKWEPRIANWEILKYFGVLQLIPLECLCTRKDSRLLEFLKSVTLQDNSRSEKQRIFQYDPHS
ncbi:hypothetical protein Gasu2_32540 [Galdieria sulphuraria]|uniref:Uncharacterized protein n=1 Tax=Galdieria sulphuraria TaxID=130081 RepID=M2Y431_GALSU|nr:uncharacterized protein Gasu_20460 [Galdieria sulphuraria]EME30584.1 hypothetical protein Gasu_20460 [Galdieria sulphuraria]GJD08979.1 hypothetical protein Gasu2_32540 [Galdieria sulphuraria]|eukprot:XP_005707104.1 hypothetical protein Gasu_20460 [Galdieria sulphuraria]